MDATAARSMLAGSPFLPSPASALAEAIETTATETGLRAKPLLWHRDPLEQTLSAYAYHLAASEPWRSQRKDWCQMYGHWFAKTASLRLVDSSRLLKKVVETSSCK